MLSGPCEATAVYPSKKRTLADVITSITNKHKREKLLNAHESATFPIKPPTKSKQEKKVSFHTKKSPPQLMNNQVMHPTEAFVMNMQKTAKTATESKASAKQKRDRHQSLKRYQPNVLHINHKKSNNDKVRCNR